MSAADQHRKALAWLALLQRLFQGAEVTLEQESTTGLYRYATTDPDPVEIESYDLVLFTKAVRDWVFRAVV